MSRRKQANPQHVHDPPGPNSSLPGHLPTSEEVPQVSRLVPAKITDLQSSEGKFQSNSKYKPLQEENPFSESTALDSDASTQLSSPERNNQDTLTDDSFSICQKTPDLPSMLKCSLIATGNETMADSRSVCPESSNICMEDASAEEKDENEEIACDEVEILKPNYEKRSDEISEENQEYCYDEERITLLKEQPRSSIEFENTKIPHNEALHLSYNVNCNASEHHMSQESHNTTDSAHVENSSKLTSFDEKNVFSESAQEDRDMADVCTPNYVDHRIENHQEDEDENIIGTSPEDEKENITAEGMMKILNDSQHILYNEKSSDRSTIDSKDLEEIKGQVRWLQQQQLCQVRWLNYLHLQLTMIASNPQAPKPPTGMLPNSELNGIQLQNMPHLLAAAATINDSGAQVNRTSTGGYLPSMAAAIERQLSSNKTLNVPQQNGDVVNKTKLEFLKANDSEVNKNQQNSDRSAGNYNPLSSLALLQKTSNNVSNGSELFAKMPNGVADENRDDSFMKHSCHYCQKIFGSDSALRIHLRSHTGERPFKCNICANRFSTKGNLKVHFVRHKEKYPHIEMNSEPIPESLDNCFTSSGLPYGMSIFPETCDDKSVSSDTSEIRQHVSSSERPQAELPGPYHDVDTAKPNMLLTNEDSRGENASTQEDVRSTPKSCSSHSQDEEANQSSPSKTEIPSNMFSMLSFYKSGSAPNMDILPQYLPRMSSASSVTSEKEMRNPSYESMNHVNIAGFTAGRTSTSSSETSKLQRLVEQIDRGKELEKNQCHICQRVLSCQSALKLHYRTHTGERPYKCDLCSRAFTTRGNLRTHYSSVHRQQLRNSPPGGGSTVRGGALQCPLCANRFMDQHSMQQHMQMHFFMHTQQQQQQQRAAEMMQGQVPNVDYRLLGMIGQKLQTNALENFDSESRDAEIKVEAEQSITENDDVFEESSSDATEKIAAVTEKRPEWEPSKQITGDVTSDDKNMGNRKSNGEDDSYETQQHKHDHVPHSDFKNETLTKIPAALDLTRSSSNPSTPTSDTRSCQPSTPKEAMAYCSSPKQSSSSLSALANLASTGSILSPNVFVNVHPGQTKEEFRPRKLTTACEICNKAFTCQSALEIHLRSHTKERPFVCRVCERGFSTKGNLKQHLLTHNITDVDEEMLEAVSSPVTGNSNSNSPVNSPSLPNPSQYNQMKRPLEMSHSLPPPKKSYPRHWCHICQKQFSSASSLQIHNRTHTGEKPFACNVCGRAFTTKGNLKVHMGTHVWGAGGSRRGRRISMDNPLISPWMQNTSTTNGAGGAPLRPRAPPQIPAVTDPASFYQQYALLASGLLGAKAETDARFHNSSMMNFNNASAARLLMPNALATSASTVSAGDKPVVSALKDNNSKSMAVAATEWIWKAYQQRTQEQVN